VDIIDLRPQIAHWAVPSAGPPVGLSSEEIFRHRRRVDSFERDRGTGLGRTGSPKLARRDKKRFLFEGHLSREDRVEILKRQAGANLESIRRAEREGELAQEQRAESNLALMRRRMMMELAAAAGRPHEEGAALEAAARAGAELERDAAAAGAVLRGVAPPSSARSQRRPSTTAPGGAVHAPPREGAGEERRRRESAGPGRAGKGWGAHDAMSVSSVESLDLALSDDEFGQLEGSVSLTDLFA
jgi:hypothetical protein